MPTGTPGRSCWASVTRRIRSWSRFRSTNPRVTARSIATKRGRPRTVMSSSRRGGLQSVRTLVHYHHVTECRRIRRRNGAATSPTADLPARTMGVQRERSPTRAEFGSHCGHPAWRLLIRHEGPERDRRWLRGHCRVQCLWRRVGRHLGWGLHGHSGVFVDHSTGLAIFDVAKAVHRPF